MAARRDRALPLRRRTCNSVAARREGHRARALALPRRDHDPHVRPGRRRGARPPRHDPGDQRPDGQLASLPGARRRDDDPRAARPARGRAARLPRRRQQRLRVADGRRGEARHALHRRDAAAATSPTQGRSTLHAARRGDRRGGRASSTTRARRAKAPRSSTPTSGRAWARRRSASAGCATSRVRHRRGAPALADDDAIVLHCLPAHYGEEITEDVALRAAVGGLGRGREPPARAEGAAGARSCVDPAQGQRPDAALPGRHGRPDRRRTSLVFLYSGTRSRRLTSPSSATSPAR